MCKEQKVNYLSPCLLASTGEVYPCPGTSRYSRMTQSVLPPPCGGAAPHCPLVQPGFALDAGRTCQPQACCLVRVTTFFFEIVRVTT